MQACELAQRPPRMVRQLIAKKRITLVFIADDGKHIWGHVLLFIILHESRKLILKHKALNIFGGSKRIYL